jgi:hypothetical protein
MALSDGMHKYASASVVGHIPISRTSQDVVDLTHNRLPIVPGKLRNRIEDFSGAGKLVEKCQQLWHPE